MYWQNIIFVFIFSRYDVYPNRKCFGNFSSGFQQIGSRIASNQTHNLTFILFYFTSHSYIEYTFGAQLLMMLKLGLFGN
jgi:hypothetical protein